MKDKVYIGFVAETEIGGNTIIPEYMFETRVFSTLEKARKSLNDWIYDFPAGKPTISIVG